MVPDRYTKAVLTVIAASLVVLVGQNFISVSNAQRSNQFQVCDDEGQCAGVEELGSLPGAPRRWALRVIKE
jgi:hypothetical protein